MAQRILRSTGYTDKAGVKIFESDFVLHDDGRRGKVTLWNGVPYVVFGEADHERLEKLAASVVVVS